MENEHTLVLIKPDAVVRGLVGKIIARFEEAGFKIDKMRFIEKPSKKLIDCHYGEHVYKPFYPDLLEVMMVGPVIAISFSNHNCSSVDCSPVAKARSMIGATNPLEAVPGTIRGDFCGHGPCNLVHASDSDESAQCELFIWFSSL